MKSLGGFVMESLTMSEKSERESTLWDTLTLKSDFLTVCWLAALDWKKAKGSRLLDCVGFAGFE